MGQKVRCAAATQGMIATVIKCCSSCRKEKATSEFHRRGSKFQSECKLCRAERHQSTWPDRRERQLELNRVAGERFREKMAKLKAKPCMDCKVSYPPWVMDFDHRPGELKLNNVAAMYGLAWSRIEAEAAKCDLVCSNCHRVRTHDRRHEGMAE